MAPGLVGPDKAARGKTDRWEAYFSWLSALGLLVVLYYSNTSTWSWDGWSTRALLVDPRKARSALAATLSAVIVARLVSHVFSAQASYIQVGAMIRTWTVPTSPSS
jgi:uncharacterized membrane protein